VKERPHHYSIILAPAMVPALGFGCPLVPPNRYTFHRGGAADRSDYSPLRAGPRSDLDRGKGLPQIFAQVVHILDTDG